METNPVEAASTFVLALGTDVGWSSEVVAMSGETSNVEAGLEVLAGVAANFALVLDEDEDEGVGVESTEADLATCKTHEVVPRHNSRRDRRR